MTDWRGVPHPNPITKGGYVDGKKGEYSTVELPNGVIETMFFPDDPDAKAILIGRTVPKSLRGYMEDHIQKFENGEDS